ncbi:DUF805 domain-containing protein [Permianibacter sp. IMCC34836]|uniref:DUF805 domain-containing protein n=1 Tax=Permianibacter fluminis TaxID=2738515 RepID=UPI00155423EC|nr:DUF805 domain-containing protein [Permianibacter fluminis]NQD38461.1 DUF805 domain-containing protein [Permianibacter fluminis]
MANPYSAPAADLNSLAGEETYEPQVFAVNGRIGRMRYLAYSLVMSLLAYVVFAVLFGIGMAIGGMGVGFIMLLLGYIPMLAVTFILARRRLNDLDKSGWLSLLLIVPLVNLGLILYMIFAAGTAGTNQFGPQPSPNSTLVKVGALVTPVLFVVGIIAAIALPAYQDYVNRAKQAEAAAQEAAQYDEQADSQEAQYGQDDGQYESQDGAEEVSSDDSQYGTSDDAQYETQDASQEEATSESQEDAPTETP